LGKRSDKPNVHGQQHTLIPKIHPQGQYVAIVSLMSIMAYFNKNEKQIHGNYKYKIKFESNNLHKSVLCHERLK
jgi:hypothetical protein